MGKEMTQATREPAAPASCTADPPRSRRRRTESTRNTIARLKTLLQARLAELESQIGDLGAAVNEAASERDIRAVNTLVRTLEKVLELERKDRAQRSRRRKTERALDDAERHALADRLERLRDQWLAEQAGPAASER